MPLHECSSSACGWMRWACTMPCPRVGTDSVSSLRSRRATPISSGRREGRLVADRAYDAIIIGAGAGGGACAWALTRRKARVLVLEAGPRYDPFHDYLLATPQWQAAFPYKPGSQGKYTYAPMQALV